ncbi:hypothetical protein [Streptomyces sp. NBC_00271]|uniref:hypothetical protein n=1 Tax=Streptomyces sp. NBC_00271 TaxID=2975697 RepID=UPI002E27E978|nr:hypothetical protein [Streptomyces sp. NBC_00271]
MIDPVSVDLAQFLTSWYGPPDASSSRLSGPHAWLPEPLKDWHELSSQWTRPLMTLRRMRAPKEITIEDGKAIFMTDAGDEVWAFDPGSPTDVYEGQLYEEWGKCAESLPEFLTHNALNEAAHNATSRRVCDEVKEELLSEILAPMTEVSFRGWRVPRAGHRVFMGDSLIADVGPALQDHAPWGLKSGYVQIQIGSKEPAAMTYLDKISNLDWLKSGRIE